MSKNSKELAVKYHGDGKLPKKKKKNPNVAEVSKMGYRDDSPYRSMPYIDIHTPNGTIDMSATGIPLWANGRVLPPYSGMHQFDSKVVREMPLAQRGGNYNNIYDALLNYKEQPDENKWELFDVSGLTSWDDAVKGYDSWQKSNRTYPTWSEGMEMFSAVPFFGKAKKVEEGMKIVNKAPKINWPKIYDAIDYLREEYHDKKADGGLIKAQEGREVDSDYNMARAKQLGYTPDERAHWPSADYETGEWLKSKEHPSAWMEYLYGYTLNPQQALRYDVRTKPEGYFGDNTLQYVPKEFQGGGANLGPYSRTKTNDNYDFNDLFLTDDEVSSNLEELGKRRERCIASGAQGCLSTANAYYNIYVAPKLNAPSSWKELDGSGVVSSKENTVDSWDVHGLNNRNVLFNKNDKNQSSMVAETDWKNLNLPIGAVVGFGEHASQFMNPYSDKPLNATKGLPLAGHSGRVVGYDTNTGEPFVYDTVNGLKRISQNTYKPITVISVDNRIANNTYDKVSSGELSFKGDFDDIEMTFPKDLEYDPDEFIPFVDALTKNKSKFANAIGMSNEEYNKNARRAAALSISETEGGNDFIFRKKWGIPVPAYIFDQMGITGSAGITQLNKDVIQNMMKDSTTERKFKKAFGENFDYGAFSFSNPDHMAFATMLLLKQNERASKRLNERAPKEYKKSNNPNFTYDDLAWYMWNQPGTILKGEAQGDNANYKKYKAALDMISVGKTLKGKLAQKKQGGSTSKLPSHLPEAYQKGGFNTAARDNTNIATRNPEMERQAAVAKAERDRINRMGTIEQAIDPAVITFGQAMGLSPKAAVTGQRQAMMVPASVGAGILGTTGAMAGIAGLKWIANPGGSKYMDIGDLDEDYERKPFKSSRIQGSKKKGGWLNKYQEGGEAYYDPAADMIFNLNNYPEGPEREAVRQHELYHRLQNRYDALRDPDQYPGPLRRPSPMSRDDQKMEYYNRRRIEQDWLDSELYKKYPSFLFTPYQVNYDKIINPEMYNNPTTAEGEAFEWETAFREGRVSDPLPEDIEAVKEYQTGGASYSVPRPNIEIPIRTGPSKNLADIRTLPQVEVTADRYNRDDLNNLINKTMSSANNQTFAAVSTRAGLTPKQVQSYLDAEGPIARVWDPYTKEFKLKTSARLAQEKAERDDRVGTITPLKERSFLENIDRTINNIQNFSLRPGDYGQKDPTKMGLLDHLLNPISIPMYSIPYVGPAVGSYQTLRSLSQPQQYIPRDSRGDISMDPAEWAMAAGLFGLDLFDVPGFKKPKAFNAIKPLEGMPHIPDAPSPMRGVKLSEGIPAKPFTPSEIDYPKAAEIFQTKLASDTEDAIEKELYNAGIIRKNEQVRRKNPEGTSKVPKNVSDYINTNNIRDEAQAIIDQLEKRGYSIDFNSPVFNQPEEIVRTFDKAKEIMYGDTHKGQIIRAYLNGLSVNKELLDLRKEIGKLRALSMEPHLIDQVKTLPANQRQQYLDLQPTKTKGQITYRGQPIDVEFNPNPHYSLTATRPSAFSSKSSKIVLKSPVPGSSSVDDLHFNIDENNILSDFGFFAAKPPSTLITAAKRGDAAAKEELDKFIKQRQRASGNLMMAAMDMVPVDMMVSERTMSVDSYSSLMSVGSKSNFKLVNAADEPGILNAISHHNMHNSVFKGKADKHWLPIGSPNQLGENSPIAKPYKNFKDVFDSGAEQLAQTNPIEVAAALVDGMKTQDNLLKIQNDMLDKQLKAGHISQEFYDANSTYWYADPADPSKGLSRKPPKMSMDNVQFMELDNADRVAFLPQKTPDHPFFSNGKLGFNSTHYETATPEQLEAIVASKGGSRAEAFAVASNQRSVANQDYMYMSVYGAISDDDFISRATSPDMIRPGGGTNWNNPQSYIQVDIRQPIPVFKKAYKKFGGEIGGRKLRKGGQNWLSKYK